MSTALRTGAIYISAAIAEIAGCFAFWAWLKLGRTSWWLFAGLASLIIFAVLLAHSPAASAGRAFAAYGGVYIAASLAWLRVVEGQNPDGWDLAGAALCLIGAATILFAPRAG